MDLPVEQLSLGGHARASHEAAGPYGRNEGEEIGGGVILGWVARRHLPILLINQPVDERR